MEANTKTLDNVLLDKYLITEPMPSGDLTYKLIAK